MARGRPKTTISERQAAIRLGVEPSTLKRWRDNGDDAPPHFVVPRPVRDLVRYPIADLEAWLRAKGYKPQPATVGGRAR